jgi:hypothetical protein
MRDLQEVCDVDLLLILKPCTAHDTYLLLTARELRRSCKGDSPPYSMYLQASHQHIQTMVGGSNNALAAALVRLPVGVVFVSHYGPWPSALILVGNATPFVSGRVYVEQLPAITAGGVAAADSKAMLVKGTA